MRISFLVKDHDKEEEILAHCQEKGFQTPASLARVALYQYMSRYPLRRPRNEPPERPEPRTREKG